MASSLKQAGNGPDAPAPAVPVHLKTYVPNFSTSSLVPAGA
jgi:hypothetical protein